MRDAGQGPVEGRGWGRANASGRRVTLGHVRVMAPEADTRADMIPATGLTGDAAALPDYPAIQRPPTRPPAHLQLMEALEARSEDILETALSFSRSTQPEYC